MRKGLFAALLTFFIFSGTALTLAQEITITPDEPEVGNCFPFGDGGSDSGDPWLPYMGFIYQNIPPFTLAPGDTLAFDLGAVNGADVQFDIELAATTSNGGTTPALPFTKVVSNTQIPLNPNGNTIVGDFEMQFTVEAPVDFPGGGLIIRFSNSGSPYINYLGCDQVLVRADSSDPSGYFVGRFYADADGLPPYEEFNPDTVGGFRVVATGTPGPPVVEQIPTMSEWGMMAAAAGFGLAGAIYLARKRRVNSAA